MDYKIAFEILEIDITKTNYNDITIEFIKKKWTAIMSKILQNKVEKH